LKTMTDTLRMHYQVSMLYLVLDPKISKTKGIKNKLNFNFETKLSFLENKKL